MRIVGIDCGVHGALAVIEITNGAPQLVDATDVPVVGTGAKERVDVAAVRDWLMLHNPDHAAVERGQAMPRQDASSGFKYGRACGALEAVIACCAIQMTIVEPSVWKRFHGLYGADKETDRQRALQLFPGAHALLALKRHHNRADAALIAASISRGAP